MRICPIASSSSGNCIYVGSENTHLLVDCGISKKRVEEGLKYVGLSPMDIDGVLITHEHTDHTCGLGTFSRKYNIPLYATVSTLMEISRDSRVGNISPALFNEVLADRDFAIGDILVHPFRTSHDAVDSVGYVLEGDGKRTAIATDLGTYNDYIANNLKGMDMILLEANHDIKMLETGPYPYPLKRRILSDMGHLSNEMAGRLLGEIIHENLKVVILGHLSKENNLPELAYETVRLELAMGEESAGREDLKLVVAKKSEPTGIFAV